MDGISESVVFEFEQALGDGEGQGNLVCCSSWGRKESDTTERLNNNFCILILYLVILLNLLMLTFLGGVYGIFYLGKDFCCHLVNSVEFLFYLSSL